MTGPSKVASGTSAASPVLPKSQQVMAEKYKSLKRRIHELEEECCLDSNRPDERKVRMREERDHIRAEMKEIEAKIQFPESGSLPLGKSTQESVTRRVEGEGYSHTLKSFSSAAIPRLRASVQSNRIASLNPLPNSSRSLSHASGSGVQVTNAAAKTQSNLRHFSANGDSTQTSPRSSQRIAARKSQRNSGGSSIAAVAAAAAQVEAAASAVAPIQPSTSTPGQGSAPVRQDVQMTERTMPRQIAESTGQVTMVTGSPIANFVQAPSMESIVRVAEAAIAAQNAANSPTTSNTTVDPNLDPSLLSETPNFSSTSTAESPNFNTPANVHKPPSVDTNTANSGASASTPTSTPTSTSSNLSNNPYLALATNYQRGSSTSPTGHPVFFPYSVFYTAPGPSIAPNAPGTYPIPYNPYYYPIVPGSNGIYPPIPGVPPLPQPPQPQQQIQPPTPSQQDQQRVVKPKRLKSHTVTTKSFSIPMVPRDRTGKPMLPLNVGIMTVINLGTVCMRDHFHTERYIFPVGYEVTRRYLSTLDPSLEVVYHCTILDGGDGPKFQIIPSDRPDKPVIAGTATGAWSSIVKQANAIRNRQHSNSVSGPDFFGLGQNTIKHLIQELSGADKLKDYVWQNFVEGGPLGGRHAAVIPALPEEYDASMPIGAYYPRRNEAVDPTLSRGLSYYPQHIIAQAEAHAAKAAQQTQEQGSTVPESSGSVISVSGPPMSPSIVSQMQQHQTMAMMASQSPTDYDSSRLVIQEFQPPQQQQIPLVPAPLVPDQDTQPQTQKRVTRSRAAAAKASMNATSPQTSSNTLRKKSTSKGQQTQRHGQKQSQTQVSTAINGTGVTTMTFASIMKAFPAPPPTSTKVAPNLTHATGS